MSLAAGTRLGPYEVVAPLGSGGMGEVYTARDTRLGRQVAIKVLLSSIPVDAERRRRFEHEARAASALNHPNVVVIHDVGDHDGTPYVVSELLDGATLRDALSRGPIASNRAIDYGAQIARGLAAAHDQGIVHRDIKPDNVFVTRDGRVKILDFGIATLAHGPAGDSPDTTWDLTAPGVIVGTVGYMSPEQVRNGEVDARSDIFALGAVLHEMLSGRRPFARPTQVETLHAILNDDPPDLAGPDRDVSPALDRIVRHCLEKEPARRFHSAYDVAFALEGLSGTASAAPVLPPVTRRRRWLVYPLAGIIGLAALAGYTALRMTRAPGPAPEVRFTIPTPEDGSLQGILGVSSAIAPDGHAVVLVVTTPAGNRLYLRSLSSTASTLLAGTDGATNPFWSPDSRSIAFFTKGRLNRIPITGGTPQTICEAATGVWTLGAWAADDTIVLSGVVTVSGLLKVSARGGRPVPLSRQSDYAKVGSMWPSMLPDGRHFLLWRSGSKEMWVGSIDGTPLVKVMDAASRAVYVPPGYLLFVREGSLMAQRFDSDQLRLHGSPELVADDMFYFSDLGQADFSASTTGVLAFMRGATASRLTWIRRDGTEEGPAGPAAEYYFLALSPTGRRAAAAVLDRRSGKSDIQMLDLERGNAPTNLTADEYVDWTPMFSPAEDRIAFASARNGPPNVHIRRLDDAGPGEQLVPPSGDVQFVTDWRRSGDQEWVVYQGYGASTQMDVMAAPIQGAHVPRALVASPADDADGKISPDGHWLAYVSNESGRSEIYVRPFAGGGPRAQVSIGGGVSPRWRRDGKELYYVAAITTMPFGAMVSGKLMAVPVSVGVSFTPGSPVPLFPVQAVSGQFEPSADGQRFLVNVGSGSAGLPITVAMNWAQRLAR